jgi:hypothetical protein
MSFGVSRYLAAYGQDRVALNPFHPSAIHGLARCGGSGCFQFVRREIALEEVLPVFFLVTHDAAPFGVQKYSGCAGLRPRPLSAFAKVARRQRRLSRHRANTPIPSATNRMTQTRTAMMNTSIVAAELCVGATTDVQ